MNYKIEIDFVEAYEVVASLLVFIDNKGKYDLGKHIMKDVEKRAPEAVQELLNMNHMNESGYLMMLIYHSPYKASFPQFIKWFEALSIGEIYELLSPYVDGELPDLKDFKHYYVKVLNLWQVAYELSPQTIELLEREKKILEKASAALPAIDLIEQATNGIRLHVANHIQHIILVPTLCMTPLNRIYGFRDTFFILYAVEQEIEDAIFPSPKLMRKMKVLGDEKRLRIMQLLANEQKTFTEIAKYMKLSKSNLHYHLTMLRSSGIIRINNYSFSEPDRYELRPQVLEQIQKEIEAYVFNN